MIDQKLTFPFFPKGTVRHAFEIDRHGFPIFDPENLNDDLPVLVDTLGLNKLKLL